MHEVVLPLSLVGLAFVPDVDSFSVDFIVKEFSLIETAIGKDQLAFAVLEAVKVLPLVYLTILPHLTSDACLFVLDPLSLIAGAV